MADRIQTVRVNNIVKGIYNIHSGRPGGLQVCETINLLPSKYDSLLQQLSHNGDVEEYAFHHIKLSYNQKKHLLSYEVPTSIHFDMVTDLRREINEQLDAIKGGSEMAADLLRLVKGVQSSIPSVEFPGASENRQRYPDGTWATYDPENWLEAACFIFEVCFAQRQPAAEDLVREMMYDKNGCPGLALVVTLHHNDPKMLQKPPPNLDRSASYTFWQWLEVFNDKGESEHRVGRAGRTVQFRDSKGDLVPGRLSFTIRDFVPEEMRAGNPYNNHPDAVRLLDETINIDHALLFGWLERAEGFAQNAARGFVTSEINSPSREVSKRPEEKPRVQRAAKVSKTKPVKNELNIKNPHNTRAVKRAKAAKRAQNDLNVNHPYGTRSKGGASQSEEDDDQSSGVEEVPNSSDSDDIDCSIEDKIRITLPLNSRLRLAIQHL